MEEQHVALAAETLFNIGPIPITNSMVTTWLVTITLLTFAFFATKKLSWVPGKVQNLAEAIIEPLFDLVESLSHDKAKVFMPIVASFFFFILFGNYFGLLPGIGSVGFYREETSHHAQVSNHATPSKPVDSTQHEEITNREETADQTHNESANVPKKVFVPYFRAINSDLNTTLGLALVSVLATHFLAIRYLGAGGYLGKFFSLNPIFLFVGLIELVGEFTKVASLSFRLFGNILAGETVLHTATTKLFAFVVPIPFYFLEIIVGFVQALIFAILTLTFMVILTQKESH